MPRPAVSASPTSFLSETAWHQVLLLLLCGVTFLPNLGATHLWDEDEAYFGSTTSEMLERGDHVVPYFNGELALHKPAFMYWVMMLGVSLFGNCEFAMRFGSTVFGTGTVLLTYHAARLLFTPRVGLWSGAVLATCLQFALVSRAAVSDPELVFFCTLSLVLFVAARRRRANATAHHPALRCDGGLNWIDWVLCYAAMGAAVLVKGPVGVVLPTATLGLTLLFERADAVTAAASRPGLRPRLHWLAAALSPGAIARTIWTMRPVTALLVVTVVAAPWYVWVGLRTHGEWPRGFLLVHNLGRFSRTFEDHAGGPFYYLVAAAVGMFPWSTFLYQSVRGLVQGLAGNGAERRPWLLLLANILVWIGFFSVSGTKLPHYILPAYPALAIVCGAFLAGWASREVEASRAWLRVSWGTLLLVGIAVLAGGGFLLRIFLPEETRLAVIAIVPLLGGLAGLWALETDRRRLAAGTMLATAVGFLLAMLAWAAPQVSRHQNSPHIAAWVRAHATSAAPRLKVYRFFQESLVYYSGRQVEKAGTPRAVAAFFQEHPHDAFLVTTRDALASLAPALPADVVELESMPRFLRNGDVVLLGRDARAADAAAFRPRMSAGAPSAGRHPGPRGDGSESAPGAATSGGTRPRRSTDATPPIPCLPDFASAQIACPFSAGPVRSGRRHRRHEIVAPTWRASRPGADSPDGMRQGV